jgi:hypothetical protein
MGGVRGVGEVARHKHREPEFQAFVSEVKVDFHPGGRATLDHTDYPFTVDIQANLAGPKRLRRGIQAFDEETGGAVRMGIYPRDMDIVEVSLRARPGEAISLVEPFTLHLFTHAFVIASRKNRQAGDARRLPRRPPARGKANDPKFYKEILLMYQGLKASGSARPAAELAEQLGRNRNTVRSWLARAAVMYPKIAEGRTESN